MPPVIVKNMSVVYDKGRTIALDKLNLEIKDGEFCVFLGPSGCGKTTALMCIAGLIVPTSGSVNIGEELVTSIEANTFVRPQDRNIAMVFQEYALYPNMTVRGNMSFALENRKQSKQDIDEKITEIASMLGIEQLLDRKPAELSGGQRQRVALGRSLVRDPSIFLLDEPLGNLDAKLREQVRFDLKRIQRNLGVTTVYVTHDQTEAMTLADRIVLMQAGKVVQEGTPNDLYRTPKNMFVAEFVGTPRINFLDCRVSLKDGAPLFTKGKITLQGSKSLTPALGSKDKCIVGIRPGDFNLVKATDPGALLGQVEIIEPLGDDILVHFRLEGEHYVAKLAAELQSQIAEQVALKVDPEALHVFDSVTTERFTKEGQQKGLAVNFN